MIGEGEIKDWRRNDKELEKERKMIENGCKLYI